MVHLERLRAALRNRYRLDREVGRGGMAMVYLADDLKHHRAVAIKVVLPELAASLGAERFLREIGIAAQLQHPHILPLYDSGKADGMLYYVMPYVEGESLADRIARERQLPVDEALAITADVAGALDYAHEHGVVHRDIKPANILLSGGRGVVTDFGIARAVSEAGGDELTQTGLALGTPAYMSPEQASGTGSVDGRSDVYALACVLYEMLAGEPPFTGPSAQAIIARHVVDTPHSLRAIRATIPVSVEAAISKALHKVPTDRFQTAGDFARALHHPAHGAEAAARATGRRNTVALTAVGLAVVILAALLGVLTRGNPTGDTAGAPSVAVLPFEYQGAPDDEYFADGITEEITTRLAQITGLRVKSREGAKLFRSSDTPIPDIAVALGVEFLLAGSVRTDRQPGETGQVRVTPRLIRASDDSYLWTQRYDASLVPGEIFAVQADIAEQVAGALNVQLLDREREAVRAVQTEDPEAHRLYLLGRFQLEKRGKESLEQSQQLFRQAIARDPEFAAAYAGLADAISLYNFYVSRGGGPELWEPAAEAARRAIALDADLAEAHASLGLTRVYGWWDWQGARRAYDQARVLDPDNPVIWYWSAEVDWVQGRLDDALAKTSRALTLDPASAVANATNGMSLWFLGRRNEAVDVHRRAAALQPAYVSVNWFLTFMTAQAGRPNEAGLFARRFFEGSLPGQAVPESLIDRTVNVLSGLADLPTTVHTIADWSAYGLHEEAAAIGYSFAGYPDSAFARLDRAVDRRNEQLPVLLNYYRDFLADDPRWRPFLARLGVSWD